MKKENPNYEIKFSYENDGCYNHYDARSGSFSLVYGNKTIKSPEYWYTCRESFLNRAFIQNIEFIFAHAPKAGPRIANFIKIAEQKLKIKNPTKIYGFKNASNRSLIMPATWWTSTMVRRQLFTILLRCGRTFGEDSDFTETLFRNPYTKGTQQAVKKFFNGYTKFMGSMTAFNGWYRHFNPNLSRSNYQKFLNQLKK